MKRYHDANKGRPAYAEHARWARVLAALGWILPDVPWNTVEPFTVAEAQAQEALWFQRVWRRMRTRFRDTTMMLPACIASAW